MFAFHDTVGRVDVAFTDRHGGVSKEPFSSLNLAAAGSDSPLALAENLRLATAAFTGSADSPVAGMRQVHGAGVTVVDDPPPAAVPVADALVSARVGLTLLVRVADCVPVLIADPEQGVVAAVHAGRAGLVAGVVPAAMAALREQGGRRLVAWVGPHVCGACYEVPAELRRDVSAVVPQAWGETSWGTAAVDLTAGIRAQLETAGAEVVLASPCTVEEQDLYSHRRDGARSGRLGGLVRVRP